MDKCELWETFIPLWSLPRKTWAIIVPLALGRRTHRQQMTLYKFDTGWPVVEQISEWGPFCWGGERAFMEPDRLRPRADTVQPYATCRLLLHRGSESETARGEGWWCYVMTLARKKTWQVEKSHYSGNEMVSDLHAYTQTCIHIV